jgi:MoxR-like ATPase
MVDYIAEEFRFLKMLEGAKPEARTVMTFAELDAARADTANVSLGSGIIRSIADLRRELATQQIVVSDRRWKNSLDVLRAHAIVLGRNAVTEDDLIFLEHVLWKDPEEQPKVRETIRRLVKGYEEEARELLIQSQELKEYALDRQWESDELRNRALIEAHTKIANILVKFDNLLREATEGGKSVTSAAAMRAQVKDLQQNMLRRM